MSDDINISDIHSLGRTEAFEILTQIARIEKKTFPANEAFPFGEELWRKKPNTRVVFAVKNAAASSSSSPSKSQSQSATGARPLLIAYAVYVRQKGVALLHKVCVAEPYRRLGVGLKLMNYVRQRLEKEGCQAVQLWVDKTRLPARALYVCCGFEEREEVSDYYAPGRTGIRMVLTLEGGR